MTQPWTIFLDHPVTLRKSYHIVQNPEGGIEFRHRRISDCIAWLDFEDIQDYILQPLPPEEGTGYHLEVTKKDNPPWRN